VGGEHKKRTVLAKNCERKRRLGKPRNQEEIIKMHLKETACDDVDWNQLVQDRANW
jgi:hypothetical protein